MLKELIITNGNLELSFNEFIYEYTVVVDGDIKALEFDYKLDDGVNLRVRDNSLNNDENIVYIDVYNNMSSITYLFYVYKENANEVSGIDNYVNSLEINGVEELSLYKVQILTTSIFLIIIILFSFIFKKRIKN